MDNHAGWAVLPGLSGFKGTRLLLDLQPGALVPIVSLKESSCPQIFFPKL